MTWSVKATERTTLTNKKRIDKRGGEAHFGQFDHSPHQIDGSYNWYEQTTNLQIDITSYCNARCGACIRNKNGDEVKDELVLEHFDIEVWERLAKEDTRGWFIGDLALNGNWGDPMMHPKLVEMLHIWTQYHPETSLFLHTNGSMRTEKFWKDMGEVCRRFTNHLAVFAVDGMEDTHSIYRRYTDFNKIVANIKAFTSTGGRANVMQTLFEHNKHQCKEIENVAMECHALYYTLRHSHGDDLLVEPKDSESYRIHACYDIEPYQVRFDDIYENWMNDRMSINKDYNVYLDASDRIKDARDEEQTVCPWFNDRQVQIDPWAKVWPCCHLSLYGTYIEDNHLDVSVDQSFIEARKQNDLKNHSLKDVLQNEWFTENLTDALNSGAWLKCRETCDVPCHD